VNNFVIRQSILKVNNKHSNIDCSFQVNLVLSLKYYDNYQRKVVNTTVKAKRTVFLHFLFFDQMIIIKPISSKYNTIK